MQLKQTTVKLNYTDTNHSKIEPGRCKLRQNVIFVDIMHPLQLFPANTHNHLHWHIRQCCFSMPKLFKCWFSFSFITHLRGQTSRRRQYVLNRTLHTSSVIELLTTNEPTLMSSGTQSEGMKRSTLAIKRSKGDVK